MSEQNEGPRKFDWLLSNVVEIFVPQVVFDEHIDWLMDELKNVVVLRAEYHMDKQAMLYTLSARRFASRGSGYMAPIYEIVWGESTVAPEKEDDAPKHICYPIGIRRQADFVG